MNNEQGTNMLETVGFTILFPAMLIVCSYCVFYLENKIGFIPTLLLLFTIFVFSLVSVFLGGKILTDIYKEPIEKQMELSIKDIKDKLADYKIRDGIYKEDHLAFMERTGKFSEIWLISPDLLTEIDSGVYAGVVRANLKKGTKYRYFVPHTIINEIRIKTFQTICQNDKNLEIYYLSDEFFFLVPDVDFAIYEPIKSVTDGKQGYMGLKIQGASERYAIRMNADFVDALASKLEECVKEQKTGDKIT
jgi:hypothetical protein